MSLGWKWNIHHNHRFTIITGITIFIRLTRFIRFTKLCTVKKCRVYYRSTRSFSAMCWLWTVITIHLILSKLKWVSPLNVVDLKWGGIFRRILEGQTHFQCKCNDCKLNSVEFEGPEQGQTWCPAEISLNTKLGWNLIRVHIFFGLWRQTPPWIWLCVGCWIKPNICPV